MKFNNKIKAFKNLKGIKLLDDDNILKDTLLKSITNKFPIKFLNNGNNSEVIENRKKYFDYIQSKISYFNINVKINKKNEEQPLYSFNEKTIYLGPGDFNGKNNIIVSSGNMIHETMHLYMTKSNNQKKFLDFVFDPKKPGFSQLHNIIEDVRINYVANNVYPNGSEIIKYSYLDMYTKDIKSFIDTGYTSQDYLDKIKDNCNKIGKVYAIESIIHNYGILSIGDKTLNKEYYELITKKLDVFKDLYIKDYNYLTGLMDNYLLKYGNFKTLQFNTKTINDNFLNDVYNDIYLKYKDNYKSLNEKQKDQLKEAMKDELGDKMDEIDNSNKGDSMDNSGDDNNDKNDDKQGNGKEENSSQDKGQGQGQEEGGKQEQGLKQGQGQGQEEGGKESLGLKDGGKDTKPIGEEIKEKQKEKINEVKEKIKNPDAISTEDFKEKFLKGDYEKIRHSMIFLINNAVNKFRIALHEKRKTKIQKDLNTGNRLNSQKLVKNVINNKFGGIRKEEIFNNVFEKRTAPGKIPNYYFSIIIDQSVSMSGNRLKTAKRSGLFLMEVLKYLKTPFSLYGYSNDYIKYSGFDDIGKSKYKNIVNLNTIGGTNEIPVLEKVEDDFKYIDNINAKKDNNKVVFLITDGESGYRTLEKIKSLKKKGINVYGIGIGNDVSKESLNETYGKNAVKCDKLEELTPKLTKILTDLYSI